MKAFTPQEILEILGPLPAPRDTPLAVAFRNATGASLSEMRLYEALVPFANGTINAYGNVLRECQDQAKAAGMCKFTAEVIIRETLHEVMRRITSAAEAANAVESLCEGARQ
jgi:hypothetical protein